MATLFITIFPDATNTLLDTPIQEMKVDIGAASKQSRDIEGPGKVIRLVRLFADANCFVAWGENPVALNDGLAGLPLGSENPEVFGIKSGDRIAVIART